MDNGDTAYGKYVAGRDLQETLELVALPDLELIVGV